MYLLIDAGNTRAKWALSDGVALFDHALAAHAELLAVFRPYLLARSDRISHVIVANVAGEGTAQMLTSVCNEFLQREPSFLTSTRELCGIRNAYPAPERLGVDRLVAMVGARGLYPAQLCVVCVGTAMTIDVLGPTGQHHGGLIVPGPRLMVSSLISSTSDIGARAAAGERSSELLAIDTRGAIEQGAEQALAALIERVKAKVEAQSGEPLTVVMTGGAADCIAPLVVGPVKIVPDLTLRGLALVACHLFPA